ncbi:acyltransferase family protein [Actinomadura madurae]|uniref:acyltransferase family protein n=1 Tax=Actinomadura madurae TaxID=1993 RepID=UPI003555F487
MPTNTLTPPDTKTGAPTARAPRMSWLDALRGLAAMVVVFEHSLDVLLPEVRRGASPWFDFGRYGVFVFFLVSGYVVPFSLERRGSVRHFWAGRVFRLYPAWFVSAALALALGSAGLSYGLPRRARRAPLGVHPGAPDHAPGPAGRPEHRQRLLDAVVRDGLLPPRDGDVRRRRPPLQRPGGARLRRRRGDPRRGPAVRAAGLPVARRDDPRRRAVPRRRPGRHGQPAAHGAPRRGRGRGGAGPRPAGPRQPHRRHREPVRHRHHVRRDGDPRHPGRQAPGRRAAAMVAVVPSCRWPRACAPRRAGPCTPIRTRSGGTGPSPWPPRG